MAPDGMDRDRLRAILGHLQARGGMDGRPSAQQHADGLTAHHRAMWLSSGLPRGTVLDEGSRDDFENKFYFVYFVSEKTIFENELCI